MTILAMSDKPWKTRMKRVSVSFLRATLSACLAKVKTGEELLVTERGKPIAKIVPSVRAGSSLSSQLSALERAGLVRTGSGKLPEDFRQMPRSRDPKATARHALLEEREKGR
jgi:prevent-host-death family protein